MLFPLNPLTEVQEYQNCTKDLYLEISTIMYLLVPQTDLVSISA
uniref:Uncharacterized protein n=1 Tax=Rhizophora mucronata TaxID=61149 RepID=A0A2P2QED2_RHIMU